jgi:hypothetical protein
MTFYDATNGMVSGLDAGTNYFFAIAPVDSFGVEAIASSVVSYTVPLPQPIVLNAEALTNPGAILLTWSAVPNEGVVGYTVYYGPASGDYVSSLNLGAVTNTVVQGLTGGQTYYFAVASMDAYGNQGPYSSEASAVAPYSGPIILQTQVYADSEGQAYAMVVNTTSVVSGNWEMDYSTDLQNWTYYTSGVGAGNGDGYDVYAYIPMDPTVPQMFFRVVTY